MVVLRPAILVGCINAVVNQIEVFFRTGTMHQIDHTNTKNQTMFCATVLKFHQFNEL